VPIPRARAIASPAWAVRLLGLALLLAAALLIGAKPAAAATPCWEQVIDDWYQDSRIDGTYPRHCYTAALKNVGEDVLVYGSFEEDVRAALQRRGRKDLRDLQSSGGSAAPATNDPRPSDGLFDRGFGSIAPANADSMPLPLLILGGLALLLIAGGAAGLVARRLRARRAA
jgi:hypothetical protein